MIHKIKAKKRVLFLTTGYPTEYRPHECIFVHRSIKALSGLIQPEVIHFRALKPGRKFVDRRLWDGIAVTSLSVPQLPLGSYSHLNTKMMEFFGEPLIKGLINASDLLHGAEAYPAGYVAGKWALNHQKPFSFNVIGSDLKLFLSRNYKRISHDWLTNLGGVVCNSRAIQKDLADLLGLLPNVKTIYRGVDTDVFSPVVPEEGPQKFLTPVRFLYLGGFHTFKERKPVYNLKGGNTLLSAWEIIDSLDLETSLVIGGPGKYEVEINQWKQTLKKPGQVFCVNILKPNQVIKFIQASDVVIIPSLSEGLPNLAKEAHACGKPVLGSNVGGNPEVVSQNVTGRVIPSRDPQALAQEILWFCDNQHRIIEMGQKGRERMMNLFSWEEYRKSMINFFESILYKLPNGT